MPCAATDPELASVGMTIKDAKDAGIEAKAFKFPFSGNDRVISRKNRRIHSLSNNG